MHGSSSAAAALAQLIHSSSRIVFFGGAGMSTASGIPDFRSTHGLYGGAQGQTYEQMLSIQFFLQETDAFWRFYKQVMLHPDAQPNAGHIALARLQQLGRLTSIITQNIDGLHQAAGSQQVLELHGSVHRNPCMACNACYTLTQVLALPGTPHCSCGGIIRPGIVFYGEPLDDGVMDDAIRVVMDCDLLIVGGTSLTVYPAAGLLHYRSDAKLALINRDVTPFDQRADLIVRDAIAEALDTAIPN